MSSFGVINAYVLLPTNLGVSISLLAGLWLNLIKEDTVFA